jgi:hypothetical protein
MVEDFKVHQGKKSQDAEDLMLVGILEIALNMKESGFDDDLIKHALSVYGTIYSPVPVSVTGYVE